MGFGDVRLAALLGLALGHVGWAELVSSGIYAGFLLFARARAGCSRSSSWDRQLLKAAFPFGPFMVARRSAGRSPSGRVSRPADLDALG